MPDPQETPNPTAEGAQAPAEGGGLSEGLSGGGEPEGGAREQLPEEYRPYSQFPWEQIPEDARPDVLGAVKKFHGDMSRGVNEAAELRKLVPELQQKAEFLDQLTGDPGFRQWWESRRAGAPAPQAPQARSPGALEKLNEHFDNEVVSALGSMVQHEVRRALGPLHQQVDVMQRMSATEKAERDLSALKQVVNEKGWPDVDSSMAQMVSAVRSGRARSVEDAYWLVNKDPILQAETSSAVKRHRQSLEHKAEVTFPPSGGPAGGKPREEFTGTDATVRALEASMRELSRK